ncbi:MAG: peptide chain release factor N(5)-glutamine methyltransferase [Epsilonproteobacteria bacterium]|nr:peptide chain release factor N(5)-glutamine methyltransferase [Campylobacterota bacterium]
MANPTIKEALKEASLILKSPKEASILLQHVSGLDSVSLILKEDTLCEQYKTYQTVVQRRLENEPIEYITGSVSFYSREFFIKTGALIPRPETEILIDKVINASKQFKKKINIAEIGTGSGVIPVMLALLLKEVHITAIDISNDALEIAKINAKRFNVLDKITFIQSSYLDGIYDQFDMIVSNPPYIANDFTLEPHLSHEPQNALFGGVIGDEMLKNIIDIWQQREVPILCCEMGYDQKQPLSRYLRDKGIHRFSFYEDLAGLDRGFVAHLQGEVEIE